jgi:hypothetical protein
VLDQFGMIFVSAARSGNDEDIISRREPLALIAAQNAMARYAIDPDKVFVGGVLLPAAHGSKPGSLPNSAKWTRR